MNVPTARSTRDAQTAGPEVSRPNLRSQGLVFSALAWGAIAVCAWLPPLGLLVQLVVLSPIILLLGVPHGALDVVFARQLLGVRSMAGWALFTAAYLLAAALVAALWWVAPGVFLAAFLLISAFHFSGDPEGRTPAWVRVLYGGAVIFCPLALHATEVAQVFSLLAGDAASRAIVSAFQWAAWPWLACIGLAAVMGAKRDLPRSVELVSVAALLSFTPPLIGFTIYFCCMHSARHVLRTRDYASAGTLKGLLKVAALPMLATLAAVAVMVYLSDGAPLDGRLAQIVFVGLAALTVPHMIVVERIRLTGWMLGRSA
jgi:Brp/Blh family beta-carotene 15,15'-monooxygenase